MICFHSGSTTLEIHNGACSHNGNKFQLIQLSGRVCNICTFFNHSNENFKKIIHSIYQVYHIETVTYYTVLTSARYVRHLRSTFRISGANRAMKLLRFENIYNRLRTLKTTWRSHDDNKVRRCSTEL